jgi:GT2 family glycosyltransferase
MATTQPAAPDPGSVLVFLDGDCVPLRTAIERHAAALTGTRHALSLGWRYDLTEAQDAAFDEFALKRGAMPFEPTRDQTRALNKRHARFRRQRLQRALGFTKPHKPKLLSANFACTLDAYRRVNGFDEAFEGWGQEDDDFGRRLYQAGTRVHLGIRDILACHQYHITRAPGDWADSPNARMLRDDRPTACELGLDSPADQPEPVVTRIEP